MVHFKPVQAIKPYFDAERKKKNKTKKQNKKNSFDPFNPFHLFLKIS